MMVFQIFGILVSLFLIIFVFLWILYKIFKKKVQPFIKPENMPIMRPVPIPTKNQRFFMRLLIWFFDCRKWELVENYHYKLNGRTEFILHEGFEFDGASIPRIFWFILEPTGLLLIPGLIHDYGYRYNQLWVKKETGEVIPYQPEKPTGKNARWGWDDIFKQVAKEVNGISFIDDIAWTGIRLGGWCVWKKHRKKNEIPGNPII